MLKLSDLAVRSDLQLGPMLVSPSRRLVEGPGGHAHVEPLIMQVLLLLLDARGKVVTRTELFDQCWGGVTVGDDSLNRAIAKVRRTGAQIAPGLFEIETIPRTGYRLTGEILPILSQRHAVGPFADASRAWMSRRMLVGAGVGTAAVAGAALWWMNSNRTDPRFTALIDRGREALRLDEPEAARFFERAVELEPGNARARGFLAYALASGAEDGPRGLAAEAAQAAERTARSALDIDPNEPNALLTLLYIQLDMLDPFTREQHYRRIFAIDPDNTLAMGGFGQFLHGVGRCREALAVVERALSIEPLWPDLQLRKAMRLWVLGRVAEADQVIDRALQLWPSHRLVRMGRLMIYAFTGRARAALALVEDEESKPILLSSSAAAVWRTSLLALETPTTSRIAAAREANIEGAKGAPATAAYAILTLSALGELDAAFDVANGFLLGRGSIIVRPRPEARVPRVNNPGWRNTFGLFVPPTKAMRLDSRFKPLADGLGLTEYWRKRGIGPDAFLFEA